MKEYHNVLMRLPPELAERIKLHKSFWSAHAYMLRILEEGVPSKSVDPATPTFPMERKGDFAAVSAAASRPPQKPGPYSGKKEEEWI